MATDLHSTESAARPTPVTKYEALIASQLARARRRIRALDLAAAAAGFAILSLAYGLAMALCDRALELSPLARQTAFVLYAVGALAYLGAVLVWPLFRHVNPYYAARRLEQTLPAAKNSVVNWIDLHREPIPAAFRAAISQRAAKDLARADLDQAISARRASWLGGTALAFFLALLVLFLLGPRQFFSLLHRAFAPFVETSIATRTRLTLVRPEEGDATVPVGRAVSFAVAVDGRIPDSTKPDAVRLRYRYNPSDPYEERLLEHDETTGEWVTTLSATEVHNGFWYSVAGGDAETPEYRVQVRSTPLLAGFDVTYHYRPYLGWKDRTTHDPNLRELRGTQVAVLARSNRAVKEGQLAITGQRPIAAELLPQDPQAMRFRLVLEKDGTYKIWFTSVEGEHNTDPMPYTIRVDQDRAPQVELKQPGRDITLPANGLLRLEGSASDDFGVSSLTLHLKLDQEPAPRLKPYRPGKSFRLKDGSYPQMLDYKDYVELDKLRPGGPLEPGQVIHYWLEAKDNCDYPGPNTGESKHFTVTIAAPDPDQAKQDKQRQQASKDKNKHDTEQDKQLANQKKNSGDRGRGQETPNDSDKQPDNPGQQEKRQESEKQPGNESQPQGAPKAADRQPNDSTPPQQSEDQKLEEQKQKLDEAIQNAEQKKEQQKQANQEKGSSDGTTGANPGKQDAASGTKKQSSEGKGEGNPQANPEQGNPNGQGASGRAPQAGQESKPNEQNSDQQGTGQASNNGNAPNKGQPSGTQEQAGREDKKEARSQAGPNGAGEQAAAGQERPDRNEGSKNEGKQAPGQAEPKEGQPNKQSAGNQARAGSEGKHQPKPGPESAGAQPQPQPGSPRENQPGKGDAGAQKDRQAKPDQQGNQPQAGSQTGAPRSEPQQGPGEPKERRSPGGEHQPSARHDTGEPGSKTGEKGQGKGASGAGADKKDQAAGGSQDGSRASAPGQPTGGVKPGDREGPEKGSSSARAEQGNQGQGKPDARDQAASEKARAGPDDKKGQGNDSAERRGQGNRPEGSTQAQPKPGEQGNRGTGQQKVPEGANKEARGQSRQAGEESGPANGQGGSKQAGSEKGGPEGEQQAGGAKAQGSKPGKTPSGDGGEKGLKGDVEKLARALKDGDPKAREDAARKLAELRRSSEDPAERKAAAEALQQAGKKAGQEPGDKGSEQAAGEPNGPPNGKAEQRGSGRNGKPGSQQPPPGQEKDQAADSSGTGKGEPGKEGQAKAGSDSQAKGQDKGQEGKGQPSGSSSKHRGTGGPGTGGGPFPGGQRSQGSPDLLGNNRPIDPEAQPGSTPDAAARKKAGDLQLEDLRKKVNKDVLKQAKMTDEDYQKFLKAYEAMLKRKSAAPPQKEDRVAPQRDDRKGFNQGLRRVEPGAPAQPGEAQRLGPAGPPPEFRESYEDFSRRLSDERARSAK